MVSFSLFCGVYLKAAFFICSAGGIFGFLSTAKEDKASNKEDTNFTADWFSSWENHLAFALNSMPLIGRDVDYDDDNDDIANNNDESGTIIDVKTTVSEGGVWYATGFAGHGIVPTALAGSLLANAILGIPHHDQQWQLFQTYFPPASWTGQPYSRMGAGTVLLIYNTWDWLSKKGVPLPSLPKLW